MPQLPPLPAGYSLFDEKSERGIKDLIRDLPPVPEGFEIVETIDATNGKALPEQTAGEFLKGLVTADGNSWAKVADTFTGSYSNPQGFEEVPAMVDGKPADEAGIYWMDNKDGYSFARGNPLAHAAMYQKDNPNAQIVFDENTGGPLVKSGDTYQWLNKPGMSQQDRKDIPMETLAALTFGKFGGKVGGKLTGGASKGVMKRAGEVAGVAGSEYIGSLGLDKIGQVMGSDQPLDHKRAAITAVLGGTAEAVLPLLSKMLASKAYVKNGKLTNRGAKVIEEVGGDPKLFTPKMIEEFRTLAADMNPELAAKRAQFADLPHPPPLTAGQITQDATTQAIEARARAGIYGQGLQDQAKRQSDDVYTAMRENVDATARDMNPNVSEVGQGAQLARDELLAKKHQAKSAASGLYDEAKVLSANPATKAYASGDLVGELAGGIRKEFALERFSPDLPAWQELAKIEQYAGAKKVNYGAIDAYRKGLNAKIKQAERATQNGAGNPQNLEALGRIKKRLDQTLDWAMEKDLLTGDLATIEKWKQARQSWADFKNTYEPDKYMQKFANEELTGEELLNVYFNAGGLGGSAKTGSVKSLQNLKGALGEGSQEWGALKADAFVRMLKNQPADGFSPDKFLSAFDQSMKNNPSMMRTLFSEQELGRMYHIRAAAQHMKVQPGAAPHGSSLHNAITLADTLFGTGGWGAWIPRKLQAMKARRLIAGEMPAGAGGASGGMGAATAANEDVREVVEPALRLLGN